MADNVLHEPDALLEQAIGSTATVTTLYADITAAENAECRKECGMPQRMRNTAGTSIYMFVFDPIALFKLQHQFGPPQAKEPT